MTHISFDYGSRGILIVIGAARSGTTYLTDILDDYFGFGMSPEGHFVLEFHKRLQRYGDLSDAENMARLLADMRHGSTLRIIREEWPPDRRFDISVDELQANLGGTTYADAVYAVFRTIAERLGKPHVGTKNPSYTTELPLVDALFPGRAKYINLVRDGRDVALSTMSMPWGQKNVYACAKSWARHLDLAAAFEHKVGAERLLNVKYEDLVALPVQTLAALERFLGIAVEPDARERFLAGAMSNALAGNFDKWRTAMAPVDIERFEAVAGAHLVRWGYDRLHSRPRLGVAERSAFECHEMARKVSLTLRRKFANWPR